jgi:hypothetical protein
MTTPSPITQASVTAARALADSAARDLLEAIQAWRDNDARLWNVSRVQHRALARGRVRYYARRYRPLRDSSRELFLWFCRQQARRYEAMAKDAAAKVAA